MPGGPDRGESGESTPHAVARVAARTPRLVGVCCMLAAIGAASLLAYDHRQTDMSLAGVALSDGRVATIQAGAFSGPTSLVVVGHSRAEIRALPPVLSRSTSIRPARSPGGLALSPNGWVLMRLGQLGHDTEGGQLTEISPSGDLVAGLPLLHWRSTSIIGVSNQGAAVFRSASVVYLMGVDGQGVPLLDLRRLGVTSDLSDLAGTALAPDGRIAVLVGTASGPGGYRVFERRAGGAADRVTNIPRADLIAAQASGRDVPGQRTAETHASVAFSGDDLVVAGDAGFVRVHNGRVQAHVVSEPSEGRQLRTGPSTLLALPHGRLAVGGDRLLVLDSTGHLHRPGFGPCPAAPDIRSRCPAVIAGHRIPRPAAVLPGGSALLVGVTLVALCWAGRTGRTAGGRVRLAVTIGAAMWVSAWLVAGLAWGTLHGSTPLLLLAGATLAILAPAFPTPVREHPVSSDASDARAYQPWVTERIAERVAGRVVASPGTRRIEVIPLPSGS